MNIPLVRTMSGQITALIRERILNGAYAPGAALLQDGIAAEFGVSKIPVREALVQLRSEGLVDIFAHKGFQVRPMSAAEALEIFSLRLAIEPNAVAEGAQCAGPEERATALTALRDLNQALQSGDLATSGNLHTAFHLSLIVPKRKPATYEILLRLHTISQRYVRLHLVPAGHSERATQEHTSLYDGWAAGRVTETLTTIQAHIRKTMDELQTLIG
jgi:DNA-binding GntR family transcriptional regulator